MKITVTIRDSWYGRRVVRSIEIDTDHPGHVYRVNQDHALRTVEFQTRADLLDRVVRDVVYWHHFFYFSEQYNLRLSVTDFHGNVGHFFIN